MLVLATFNIFWFPGSESITRTADDEALVVGVIRRLGADVLVFQEILDVPHLGRLLASVDGREYRLADVSAASGPAAPETKKGMRVALAYDAKRVDILRYAELQDASPERRFQGRRRPVVAHLVERAGRRPFTVVGVHLKSGWPKGSDGSADPMREWECEFVAEWVCGKAGGPLPGPPTTDVVVLGDFNLVSDHPAFRALRSGAFESWCWLTPRVVRSTAAEDAVETNPDEQWSTFLDRAVIDHVGVSPSLVSRIADPGAQVYAFDLDPDGQPRTVDGSPYLRRRTDFRAIRTKGAPAEVVDNLYRVSDHRPVRVRLELA